MPWGARPSAQRHEARRTRAGRSGGVGRAPDWAKIEELFHAALQRKAAERETLLAEACHGDEKVRRELLSLLACGADAERMMAEPAEDAATRRVAIVRGTRLGPYEVTELIGSGGMGEVYRARDVRLGRDVAIKVLPDEVAHDPEARARLGREARAVAALSHPHIAALFDIGETGGTHYLVMELLEGATLAARLRRGALPEKETLRIGGEIAEALGAAHGRGVVHRDVKPANVMLTRTGAKLLDFGLARQWRPNAPGETAPTELAEKGIAGTLPYMAPEQLEGREVGARTDIWGLGCVLFEMLTGKRAFEGDSQASLIAAIEKDEAPSAKRHRPATPVALDRLVGQCLKKDPAERWQSAQDVALRLRELGEGEGTPSRSRRLLPIVAATGAIALLLGAVVSRLLTSPEKQPAAHLVLDTPEDLTLPDFDPVAVSPDGRHVVFAGLSRTGTTRLWIRSLDSPQARALPGTEDAEGPFWSPDSTSVAFSTGAEIRKVVLPTGTVQRVCALPLGGFIGGTWSDAGTIVFAAGGYAATLYFVPAAGGPAAPLTSLDKSRGETGHYWPQFLPGGRRLFFQVRSSQLANAGLFAASLEAPAERRRILPDGARFLYAAGRLLAVRDGTLAAQPFDAQRLVPTGEGVPIASDVAAFAEDSGSGCFSASATGRLAWLSGHGSEVRLQWVDRAGKPLSTLGEPGRYHQIVLSPDDRRVAVEVEDAGAGGRLDLWVIDVQRGVASRLTTDPANERDPVWSPDSRELVFSSDASGDASLLRKALEGSDAPAPLPGGIGQTPGREHKPDDWSRAGNTLVYRTDGQGEQSIWVASLDGNGPAELLRKDRFGSDEHHVSPDGRWLAYISMESGRYEVYVEPFRRRGERVRVSTSGGGQPRWRGDAKELFYLSLDGRLMAASVREGAAGLEVGVPTMLVAADRLRAVVLGPDMDDYAVTADGERFLVKVPAAQNARQRVHVLLNWTSLLE